VWPVQSAQVFPRPQLNFSFQNLNFQRQKSLKIQYLPLSESKCYQLILLNPVLQELSNNTKGTPIPPKFSAAT
jgi:hypothetical protein